MRYAVCLYVRNEERDIAEWLAYQHVIGFDTCIVYDNGSDDRTAEIVHQASLTQDIRLVEWSSTDKYSHIQSYMDCIARFGSTFEWIAFFDADEFLVLRHQASVKQFLAAHAQASAIAINWAFFGSNGHHSLSKELTLEAFTRRAPQAFQPNSQFKSIVRPRFVKSCINSHCFDVDGAYCRPGGESFTLKRPGIMEEVALYEWCQLNHYFVRSRQHWIAKALRGYRHARVRTETEFKFNDRNDEEDLQAAMLAPSVRRQMASYQVEVPFTIVSEKSGVRTFAQTTSALEAQSLAKARRLEGADKVWVYGLDGSFVSASDLAHAVRQKA